jgi:hypothetical protein
MGQYFISAHGTWVPEDGWTLVPSHTTIYFFSPHGSLLNSQYSDFYMDMICNPGFRANEDDQKAIGELAVEIVPAGERVRNYILSGSDTDFRDVTGIYRAGAKPAVGMFRQLVHGSKTNLRELVGGIGGNGSIGTTIYWGACRQEKGKKGTIYFTGNQFRRGALEPAYGSKDSLFGENLKWSTYENSGFESVVDFDDGEGANYDRLRALRARLQGGGKLIEEARPTPVTRRGIHGPYQSPT